MKETNKTYWYNVNPELLEEEKAAMAKCFPGFELGKLDDGRLYWMGALTPGVYEAKIGHKKSYYVMAIYHNNHPFFTMGPSVCVYPIEPDEQELITVLGSNVLHFLSDSNGMCHLYPLNDDLDNFLNAIKGRTDKFSAVIALQWAYNWFSRYESLLIHKDSLAHFTPRWML